MSGSDYTPIDFRDIRKGDRIRSLRDFTRPTGTRVHDEVEGMASVFHPTDGDEPAEWRDADDLMHVAIDSGPWSCYVDPDSRTPEIPVGTAGTATVRGVEGVRVMRTQNTTNPWVTPICMGVSYSHWHPGEVVTGFVPDEILTDERVEQIRAEERERIARYVEEIGRIGKTRGCDLTDAEKARWNAAPEVLCLLGMPERDGVDHGHLAAWLRNGAR